MIPFCHADCYFMHDKKLSEWIFKNCPKIKIEKLRSKGNILKP
ncbi:hypothetical protein TERMP_00201 [Thermococcus barophilus MP]|uniref:Uncharacterized protein n=1 Tax=Thermococcus barophilus (strain DSM 11836 / MP) TaxID=391623 RepID=F0LI24_THEBM|nr:hypothetical protein TERMP_00201 [Thermococcus barophilus MP]